MSYPFLSLSGVKLDPDLVARIPAYLAYYHLVLPIAAEDEQLTLLMAYPDNPKVVARFADLLGQQIVAVRGDHHEIRQALDQCYTRQTQRITPQILNTLSQPYLHELAKPFQAYVVDTPVSDFDSLLAHVQQVGADFHLIGVELGDPFQAQALLYRSAASLLLTHQSYPMPRRILVNLQGHSPDLSALQVALQLAGFYQADVTLLSIAAPMKRHHIQGVATLLDSSTKIGEHLQNCQEMIQKTGIAGYLKVRQGLPEVQIATEFITGGYDLLVIAVETYGDFIYRVFEQMYLLAPQAFNPVLAVKPYSLAQLFPA